MKRILLIIIVIIFAILLIIGSYLLGNKNNDKISETVTSKNPIVLENSETKTPETWKTYNNEQYKYQIQYPKATIESISSKNGYFSQELDTPLGDNEGIKVFIVFPKDEACGRYGAGVASKKISEEIKSGDIIYKMSGWIEDPKNYSEWQKNNPQYASAPNDPTLNTYSKVLSMCGNKNFSFGYSIKIKGAIDNEKISEADTLAKEILSTFKILK